MSTNNPEQGAISVEVDYVGVQGIVVRQDLADGKFVRHFASYDDALTPGRVHLGDHLPLCYGCDDEGVACFTLLTDAGEVLGVPHRTSEGITEHSKQKSRAVAA